MSNKILLALIAIVAVIFVAGCVNTNNAKGAQNSDIAAENTSTQLTENKTAATTAVETPLSPANKTETGIETAASEKWCAPTKINFIAEPYVSVHSPKLSFIENALQVDSPIVSTLDYEDAYRAPLTGEFIIVTKLGIPAQRKVTDLFFQTRMTHSDGSMLYSEPFKLKEEFNLVDRIVYSVSDKFKTSKEGTIQLSSKLSYKIDGVEHVQCTAENKIPFFSSEKYTLPSLNSLKVGNAVSYAAQYSNLNAYTNISFVYSGAKPDSLELRIVSTLDSSIKAYFTGDNPTCNADTSACSATLYGYLDADRKQLACSSSKLVYVQASTGDVQKNALVELKPADFLKNFGGCAQ